MLTALAVLGWLTALFLGTLLLVLTVRWRTALGTREWVLAPVDEVRNAAARLEQLTRVAEVSGREAHATRDAIEQTRGEFDVLRGEIEQKAQELRTLRLGAEFHSRRPLLLAIARAIAMIKGDEAQGIAPSQTVAGVHADLMEALEDSGVEIVAPQVGEDIQQRGVDMALALVEEATNDSFAGTIASVDAPAYIYRGPGAEEVLIPARVRVYRTREA